MMMKAPILAVAAALTLASASNVSGSVAKAMQFEEKVSRADSVVLGEVVRSSSRFDDSGKWIVTDTTLRVERALKGTAASEIVITVPGGSVGGVHQQTVGVPRFDEGSEKVVFLKQNDSGATVVGMSQGTYDVHVNGSGAKVVQPMSSELILVDARSGMVVAPDEGVKTIEQFESAVRAVGNRRPLIQAASSVTARINEPEEAASPVGNFFGENRLILSLLAIGAILSAIPFLIRKR